MVSTYIAEKDQVNATTYFGAVIVEHALSTLAGIGAGTTSIVVDVEKGDHAGGRG